MNIAIVLLLVALVIVLIAGLFVMGIGGKADKKYSNKLMMARVAIQALIILIIGVIVSVSK